MQKCAGCETVRYCDGQCQASHLPLDTILMEQADLTSATCRVGFLRAPPPCGRRKSLMLQMMGMCRAAVDRRFLRTPMVRVSCINLGRKRPEFAVSTRNWHRQASTPVWCPDTDPTTKEKRMRKRWRVQGHDVPLEMWKPT